MWILPLIGYTGVVLGFGFLTLAIASGLYYLSELVEEHTVPAKKLLTRLIYVVIAVYILLVVVDGFPFWLSLLGVISHIVYSGNLRHFPTVRLSDPVFIISCGLGPPPLKEPSPRLPGTPANRALALVLLNHFLWFRRFSHSPLSRPPPRYSTQSDYDAPSPFGPLPTFTEVASFFGLLVWLIPFAFFVSLSAGDNVLPSMGSEYATGDTGGGKGKTKKKGLAKAAVDRAMEWIRETGEKMGFWREDRTRRF